MRLVTGDGALPALIAAQRFLAASAIAFRPAALNLRLGLAGAKTAAPAGDCLFGEGPRRFGEPWRA